MAGGDKRRRTSSQPTNGQLQHELKTLRSSHEQLKATVGKLKDILQVQDNWHSRVSKWIKKKVELFDDREEESIRGILLWTDRYNLGIEVDGNEEIFNKGHVVRIRLAA
jgi:hypothetical protein